MLTSPQYIHVQPKNIIQNEWQKWELLEIKAAHGKLTLTELYNKSFKGRRSKKRLSSKVTQQGWTLKREGTQ